MDLYGALKPLLFRMSAEGAHDMALRAGRLGQLAGPLVRAAHRDGLTAEQRQRLATRVMGLDFRVPLGTAAGLDKNAVLVPLMAQIGCGFCEVGSVSALARPGNPKPRAFRLPEDRALVNRLGLGNQGVDAVATRLAGLRRPEGFPLGINVVKTHDPAILGQDGLDDFVRGARTMLPHADFLVLNVSCPNTTEGKTFEDPAALAPLVEGVMAAREEIGSSAPVLVKLSPPPPLDGGRFDTGPVDELVDLCLERGAAGFVATNTAPDRAGLRTGAARLDAIGKGGLSGAPLRERALAMVRHLRRRLEGRAVLVGVGGVDTPEAAYERILAGADLVEVYTGLVYAGPGLVTRAARAIAEGLERDGFATVADAVGARA